MKNYKYFNALTLPFVVVLFLSACQTVPNDKPIQDTNNETSTAHDSNAKDEKARAPEVDLVNTASATVISLLDVAEQHQKSGDTAAAINTLERAIRIAPRFPESYYRLAEIRYEQMNYHQANSLAQKAISLGASGTIRTQSLKLIDSALKEISQ